MKEVYVIVRVDVFDYEEEVSIQYICSNKDKAYKKFKKIVKEEKKFDIYYNRDNEDFDEFIDTDSEFCCWEAGNFSANHTYIMIEGKTVIE